MRQGKIEIPATSANIGPGYDVLGIALNIKNSFEWEYTLRQQFQFEVTFSELVKTTTPKDDIENIKNTMKKPTNHLFIRSYQALFDYANKKMIPLKVHIYLNVPISRGLGSSATVIVAGLMIANEVLNEEYSLTYSREEIFELAYQIEGHPDNIAPALWNSMVINIPIIKHNKVSIKPLKIDFRASLKLVGVIPHYQTSTNELRKSLPQQVLLKDVAFQSSRLATMVHLFQKESFTQADGELLKVCLADKIHQQYRFRFLTGAEETFQDWEEKCGQGILGYYISGSGSTLLAFLPRDKKSNDLDLTKAMRKKGVGSTQVEFTINQEGPYQTHI